jgi:hypothetical protein
MTHRSEATQRQRRRQMKKREYSLVQRQVGCAGDQSAGRPAAFSTKHGFVPTRSRRPRCSARGDDEDGQGIAASAPHSELEKPPLHACSAPVKSLPVINLLPAPCGVSAAVTTAKTPVSRPGMVV